MTDKNLPGVSVVIPAYNCASTVAAAVESALNQTYGGATEIIVVNDGSPDRLLLEAALRPFLPRIKYLSQRNRGVSLARNAGVLASSAEWVAFLDADDYWYPHALSTLFETASDRWDMVYGNADMVGKGYAPGETYRYWSPSSGPVSAESLLTGRCSVLTSSVLVKRNVVIEAGMFDPSLHHSEDLELWMRIAMNGRSITYTDVTVLRRLAHGEGQSEDRPKMALGSLKICERVLARKDASEQLKTLAAQEMTAARRRYWKYKVKKAPSLYFLTRNPIWCYFRHNKIDGYCATCNRTW